MDYHVSRKDFIRIADNRNRWTLPITDNLRATQKLDEYDAYNTDKFKVCDVEKMPPSILTRHVCAYHDVYILWE